MRHSPAPSGLPPRASASTVLDRPAAGKPGLQYRHHLRGIDFARQTRQLGPVGAQQDHRRIATHVEARSQPLCAGPVAIDEHRHEGARALGEVLPIEQRRFEVVARRTPARAPVQQDRLALGAPLLEDCIDVGVTGGANPGDAGRHGRRPCRRGRDEYGGDDKRRERSHGFIVRRCRPGRRASAERRRRWRWAPLARATSTARTALPRGAWALLEAPRTSPSRATMTP